MIKKIINKIYSKKSIASTMLMILVFAFSPFNNIFAVAGTPLILHHQGRLLDSAGNLLGGSSGTNFCFRFSIWDVTTGGTVNPNQLWPGSFATPSKMTVNVKDGILNVDIGDTSAGGDALDFDFNSTDEVYLNIEVANSSGGSCASVSSFETLSPRQRIVSAGYAINSKTVGGFTPSQTPTGNQIPVLNSGVLDLGTNNITMTGSLGTTLARILKGWFTDLEVTNPIVGSITGNAGTASLLQTARSIYGNSFNGSADLTQIISSAFGGTGNGFTKFTGPTTAEKTFTLPNASATLLYDGGALGTPSSGVATNLTGTASGLTAGTVTTNANLTGAITSIGNATSLGSFTSANLLGALSDETGTGVAVFDTSPTFTTNITTPLIVGGSAIGSNIIYKSTTGAGTTTGIAHQFVGGTNGGTVAMTLLNNGNVGIGTTSPGSNLDLRQRNNGDVMFNVQRSTDVTPAGDFIDYKTAAGDILFRVDNSGDLYAGGIINSGSQTIVSTSTPQFRVQYDPSNEWTSSTNITGTTTFGFNGTTPRAIWIPQTNSTTAFQFQNAAGVSVLNIDTTGGNVDLGTNNITMTGSLGTTLARILKGWFTDLEVTNPIVGSITGNAGTASLLQTARSIYGNSFNGSADLTQIISSAFGGTGNGFTKFTGPTTTEKTFTLPDASATILTDNTDVTVAQGGTGVSTFTTNGVLYGNGATSILATAQGAANTVLVANAGAPSFSAAINVGTSVSSPIFQGIAAATTFGNATYASTLTGSGLTVVPTAWTATPTISGLITANAGVTLAANQNITFTSGTGNINQTFVQGAASDTADAISVNDNNTTVAGTTVNGLGLTLTNASAPLSGINTVNGINFPTGSIAGSNVTNGINFASATGFTNFLKTPSIVISSAGAISGVTTISSGAITSSGALNLGTNTITSGLINGQTISSTANFTGTLAVAGAVTLTTDLGVASGGTGVSTFTTNGVLYGNGATSILATAQGAANTVLVANAGAPSFSSAINVGTSVSSPIFQGIATATTFGNVSYLSTITGSSLTVAPTAWTATPTISGLITATSGLTSNGTLTANGVVTLGDNGDNVTINSNVWDITSAGAISGVTTIATSGEITSSGYLQLSNDNLLHNGDFETGTTAGWAGLTSVTTGGYSGNYTSQMTGSSSIASNDYIPVNPVTDVIQLEAWVKKSVAGVTPGVLYFGYYAYDANKTIITTAPCGTYCYFATSGWIIPADSAWHKVSATTTGEGTSYPNFPVGTKFIRILGLVNYTGSSDAVTQIDHVTLKRVNNGPLFVGNNFTSTNLTDQNQITQLYTTSANDFIIIPPSSGNVGIGTAGPGAKLDVAGTVMIGGAVNSDVTVPLKIDGMAVTNGTNLYGNYGAILLGANAGYTTGARKYLITNALGVNKFGIIRSVDATTDPALGTAGAITSGTADFVIDNTGNVGIGTTTPNYGKLVVSSLQTNASDYNWLVFNNQSSGYGTWNIYKSSNNDLAFGYGTSAGQTYSNGLTLQYGGNVGIGMTGPDYKLQVSSGFAKTDTTIRTTALFGSNEGATSYGLKVGIIGAATPANSIISLQTGDNAINTGSLLLQGYGGNVGVGLTTAPSSPLHVSFPTGGLGIMVTGTGTGTTDSGSIRFGNNLGNDRSLIFHGSSTYSSQGGADSLNIFQRQNAPIAIATNSVERIRILGGGNVGIGTAVPDSKLSVGGAGITGAGIYGTGTAYGIYADTSGGGSIGIYSETAVTSGIAIQANANGTTGTGLDATGSYAGVTGTGVSYGGYFTSTSGIGNYGLYGIATGIGVGGSGSVFNFYAAGTGTDYGTFTGGHEAMLAVDFPKDVKPGMLVSTTGEVKIRKNSISSTLPTVKLTDTANDNKVFGIFATTYDLPSGHWYNKQPGEQMAVVNALGEGLVWVTDYAGEVKNGDRIISSPIPGYGMKDDGRFSQSYVVMKITEEINWSTVTETVEYNGITYKAHLAAGIYDTLSVASASNEEFNLNLQGIAGTITPLVGSPSESFVTAFFENIYIKVGTWMADAGNGIGDFFANRIHTKEICVAKSDGTEFCANGDQLEAMTAGTTINTSPSTAPATPIDATTTTPTDTTTTPTDTNTSPTDSVPPPSTAPATDTIPLEPTSPADSASNGTSTTTSIPLETGSDLSGSAVSNGTTPTDTTTSPTDSVPPPSPTPASELIEPEGSSEPERPPV